LLNFVVIACRIRISRCRALRQAMTQARFIQFDIENDSPAVIVDAMPDFNLDTALYAAANVTSEEKEDALKVDQAQQATEVGT
jgi:hypothetical protein